MKYTILLLALVGCSSPKPPVQQFSSNGIQTLIIDKQVQEMSRNEVIMAVNECEGNGLRAVVLTTKRFINGFSSDVIFQVTCAPKYKQF